MGAGDTTTDGVAGAGGKEGGGTGVEGRVGGARDIVLSSSALADERVMRGGGWARAGLPDLLIGFLALSPVDGPAAG
jgi:hypothetical protein